MHQEDANDTLDPQLTPPQNTKASFADLAQQLQQETDAPAKRPLRQLRKLLQDRLPAVRSSFPAPFPSPSIRVDIFTCGPYGELRLPAHAVRMAYYLLPSEK